MKAERSQSRPPPAPGQRRIIRYATANADGRGGFGHGAFPLTAMMPGLLHEEQFLRARRPESRRGRNRVAVPAMVVFVAAASRGGGGRGPYGVRRSSWLLCPPASQLHVFILSARNSDVGCSRLRALQCGFGLDHRDLIVNAGFIERRESGRALFGPHPQYR